MTVPAPRRLGFGAAAITAAAVLLAACGSADTADSGAADSGSGDGPDRIVSLSPSATETLFAVGAGDQVVAVDELSNFPDEAPVTDLSGYTPNIEAILGFEPDLVLGADLDADVISGLEQIGVEVLDQPAPQTVAEAYDQIEQIGAATGHVGGAAEVVAEITERIDAAVSSAPQAEGLTYYHELDESLYTATGDTFIGQVYALFGLENIAGPDIGGITYPQLQAEQIITDDPDLIFLADTQCCGVTAESVADRPGWADITAVEDGHVFSLDEDIASRWGPRIADLVEQIGALLAALPAPETAGGPVG